MSKNESEVFKGMIRQTLDQNRRLTLFKRLRKRFGLGVAERIVRIIEKSKEGK